jgi:hypothetical protein
VGPKKGKERSKYLQSIVEMNNIKNLPLIRRQSDTVQMSSPVTVAFGKTMHIMRGSLKKERIVASSLDFSSETRQKVKV